MKREVWLAILTLSLTACNPEMMKVTELKPIPDAAYAKGVSAPFCGVVGDALVVAGGANFPDKSLLEGGTKRVYADIWALEGGEWVHAGVLPDSTAYGATFAVDDTLILAGGNVCGVTTDKVYALTQQNGKAVLRALPPLPEPMEQCGWTRSGDRLYLVGGAGTTGVYTCTIGSYEWTKLADLPEPLVQPVAFASGDRLYVWGGFNPETLEVSDRGIALAIPVIPSEAKESLWRETTPIPDGGTFVGATGATLPDGRLAIVGGVNRAIFARALHNTPEDRIPYLSKEPAEYQFRQAVYAFDPETETWAMPGSEPACALAGPGVAVAGVNALFVAGGELKPGVRSPKIFILAW
jgi:cyclically-permuted mutarotase family protein